MTDVVLQTATYCTLQVETAQPSFFDAQQMSEQAHQIITHWLFVFLLIKNLGPQCRATTYTIAILLLSLLHCSSNSSKSIVCCCCLVSICH